MEMFFYLAERSLRLLLAMALSSLVGWERERKNKPAGLKTHMLVGLGSAAAIISALDMNLKTELSQDIISIDPTRVIQGVIGGIGFLGAGSIIQSTGSVAGLTTAASIWVTGILGLILGIGNYRLGFMLTFFALITLRAMSFVDKKFIKK